MNKIALTMLIAGGWLLWTGCTNNIEQVRFFDRKVLPQQILTNAEIIRSQHGKVRSAIDAPVIEQYNNPDARTVYSKGVNIVFFSDDGDTNGSLCANFAISWEQPSVMLARDSVIIINYSSGDTIYLKELVWNREVGRIFSNYPIEAHNGPQVTFGDSFHSDDSLHNMQITNQHGVFILEDS